MKRSLPTIGILPGWSVLEGKIPDRYLAAVLRGLQSTARAQRCHLLLAWGLGRVTDFIGLHPAWPVASPDADFAPVGPWNTDGLIVFAPLRHAGHSRYLQELTDQGFPVLFIATGERDPMISADNRGGIRQAMLHLMEHGHRQIAFVAGDPTDQGDSATRLSAYHELVSEFGLSADPRLVVDGWHNFSGGYDAARAILGSGVRFSALLASDDSSAIGAMAALRAAGRHMPRDVAVIGFDDQPDAIAQVPPLASVHVALDELGCQALTMMLNHLSEGRPLETVQVATTLARRQSCGCAPHVVSSAGDGGARPRARPALAGAGGLDSAQARQSLVDELLAAIPPEARRMPVEQEVQFIGRVLAAFHDSLLSGRPDTFQLTLMDALEEAELTNANLTPLQEMVSILRRG